MDERDAALATAYRHAQSFLGSLTDRPVAARAGYPELLEALGGPLPRKGQAAADVVDALVGGAEPGLVASPGGRFFGFVVGGTLPAALAADWLASVWDQNAGLSVLSPAAAAVETVAGSWLLQLLGLPASAAVGFVTGATMANFTCLAAARHAVLAEAGWDVTERGLHAGPPVRLVVGADRHDSIELAARYLGLGREALVPVPSDDEGRIRTSALATVLEASSQPTIVCLQAGEVHTGAFDPLHEAIAECRRHGAWVHVDGAFGLWAAASERTRHLTAGCPDADSWATDAHKTLNVPYDSGLAIVRDPRWMSAALGIQADYLVQASEDPFERTPEMSRRARGFPVWAALRSLGSDGVSALVDDLCDRAGQFAAGLASIPGVELVNEVVFTQVMVAFGDDERTRRIGAALMAEGTAVLTPATWRGRGVLRCAVSNWATTPADVDRTVAAVRRLCGAEGVAS